MADASYELRSPLAVLGNGVEALDRAMRRNDSAQIERSLELMRREIGAMSQLVDDLLVLARYERPDSTGQAAPSEVEPMPLLEEVCERARLLASGQDLRLEWPRQ
jgi:signal transduction histidine kinase